MPESKRRKRKNGKKVGPGARIVVDPNKESSVTLQDLINVLAFQESQKPDDDPTKMKRPETLGEFDVIAEDAVITMAEEIPVNVVNEDGSKRQIGTAERDPFNPEQVSMDITDPEMIKKLSGDLSGLSVADFKEDNDER